MLDRSGQRRVFRQAKMGSPAVVVVSIVAQQATQVALASYDHMVKEFPTDRSDDTFDIAILPG